MTQLQPLPTLKPHARLWIRVGVACVVVGLAAGAALSSIFMAIADQRDRSQAQLCTAINDNRAVMLKQIDRGVAGSFSTEGLSSELRQLIELSRRSSEDFARQAHEDLAPLPCSKIVHG